METISIEPSVNGCGEFINGSDLIVSGRLERWNNAHEHQGTVEGQTLKFRLRPDTLFSYETWEDHIEIMKPADYVRDFNNGNIGPGINIEVRNGYVITVSAGA